MSGEVFYPSCVVNFTLRFDELLLKGVPVKIRSADELAKLAVDPKSEVSDLEKRKSVFPALLENKDTKTSFIFSQIPKSASIDLKGYREASSFSLTFDWRVLPIDPRLIRACGVEIYMGTVAAGEYAGGIVSTRTEAQGGGRTSILNTRKDGYPREDTLLMIGIVDSYDMSHSGSGSEVTLAGRDLRCLFLDTQMPEGSMKTIDVTLNIVQCVLQVLRFHPFGEGITLQAAAGEFPDGKFPSPATKDLTTQFGKSVKDPKKGRGNVKGDSSNLSMWDAITYLCFACGCTPHWIGRHLRIRPARSLYSLLDLNNFDPNVPTPFLNNQARVIRVSNRAGGEVNESRKFPLMVFGRDITDFKFSRQFNGGTPKVVEVTGVDPTSDKAGIQQVVKVRWPENLPGQNTGPAKAAPAKGGKASPAGKDEQEDVFRYQYYGIVDKGQLTEIAINLFEEISRGEIGGSVSTKSLSSFGGSNRDPDLLRIRVGTAIEFALDATRVSTNTPVASTLLDSIRMEFEAQVAEIKKRIPDDELARAIVTSTRADPLVLQRYFRIKNVTYKWGAGSGIEVSFDFQNYVEARFDVAGVGGKEAPKDSTKKGVGTATASTGGGVGGNKVAAAVQEFTTADLPKGGVK